MTKQEEQHIPLDLAGYQEIVWGRLEENDLMVSGRGMDRRIDTVDPLDVGSGIEELGGFPLGVRFYRRMAVATQGGHDLPDNTPPFPSIPDPVAKAKTNDKDKAPLSTLPPAGIEAVAFVQAYGKIKYGEFNNYRKGMEHSRLVSCAMRHLMAHMKGEDLDPESRQLHLAHAACRILFLIQNINDRVDIDDRYKGPTA